VDHSQSPAARQAGLGSNTAWMLLGLVARSGLQLAAFVLLARSLGAAAFGSFSGALAVAALLSPFVELGGYSLIVRDLSRGVLARLALGRALYAMVLNILPGLGVLAVIKWLALPTVPWQVALCVGSAELIGARWLSLVSAVHVGQGVLWRNAVMEVASGATRLVLVLALTASPSLSLWAWLYLSQSLLMGVAALSWASASFGRPSVGSLDLRERFQAGLHFAVGTSAQNAYTDLDKIMLPRLAGLEAVGLYTGAFRFVVVAFLPLNAFLGALYPRFFEAGQRGYPAARRVAFRALPLTAAYGSLACAGLWLAAPLLPRLLGADFEDSVQALRALSALVLVQSLYFPFADALTGSGHQHSRTIRQVLSLNWAGWVRFTPPCFLNFSFSSPCWP
jgi:O-antigen/teichoic acid export membrane protein